MLPRMFRRLANLVSKNPLPLAAARASADYLFKNPLLVWHLVRNAAGLRIVVPLDALRWTIGKLVRGKRAPKRLDLYAGDRALGVAIEGEVMSNPFAGSLHVHVEEVKLEADAVTFALRLSDVKMQALAGEMTPLGMLLKSMDLSKPATLLNFVPKRPPVLVEAAGDRVVIDLLRAPALADNPRARKIVGVLAALLDVVAIYAEDDNLVIALRTRPAGLPTALAALQK